MSILFIYDMFYEQLQLLAGMSLEEYSANMDLCFITFVEGYINYTHYIRLMNWKNAVTMHSFNIKIS